MTVAVSEAGAAGSVIHVSSKRATTVKVAKGKPQTIKTDVPFYEIVVGDPDVANVNPLTDRSFYVLGNELGTTGIALFDENKQLVGTIDVEVTLDTDRLASTIRQAVPGNDIKVSSANGRLVLSGNAKDAVDAGKAAKIAERFSGDEEVINSLSISSSQQVQLNVRFVEVNRQIGQTLGTQLRGIYVAPGGTVSFNPTAISAAESAGINILNSSNFSIEAVIKALEQGGHARRLAEPNLIARSGETASFLAGGEFPIPVAQDQNQITVEYKKFGVSLEFTPTVLSDGLINLDIAPEVSSVDTSASINVNGLSLPGFVVRRAKTSVDLKSGQSFMIAGLLQTENGKVDQSIPGAKKLPILGQLFSSKEFQRRETDLVVIITPYLVKPVDPSKKMATPLDQALPSNGVEYFGQGLDEVKVSGINRTKSLAITNQAADTGAGHYLDLWNE
ncbi:MAG: type II and III secretion system protein family protein [Rhizobiaceae bacterium]